MKRRIKNLLGAVILGGSILSFGSTSLANPEPLAAPPQSYLETCHSKHHFSDMMTQLVSQKIITQEQATKWMEFRETKRAERKAQWEKVKDLSPKERQAYWKNEKPKRLEEVVKAGIITQEQADQIKELWTQNCNRH